PVGADGTPDVSVSGRVDEEGLYLHLKALGLEILAVPDASVLHVHYYTGRSFFRQALRLDRLSTELAQNQLGPLFDFIRKYWHLKKEDLKNKDFDLEECFTLIDLQRREAETSDDQEERARTLRIEFILTQLLMDYLCECEHRLFESAEFQDFGRRIFNERAAILTVNYDTLLETAIERASSPWNPPLHLRACH
ncbi:MAG: hypothetical protein IH897_16325, partial [Planctomycetes bacterium]|nr:hypothetical protein [Planctomycetota bacterium]